MTSIKVRGDADVWTWVALSPEKSQLAIGENFVSLDEALAAAQAAYPDVTDIDLPEITVSSTTVTDTLQDARDALSGTPDVAEALRLVDELLALLNPS